MAAAVVDTPAAIQLEPVHIAAAPEHERQGSWAASPSCTDVDSWTITVEQAAAASAPRMKPSMSLESLSNFNLRASISRAFSKLDSSGAVSMKTPSMSIDDGFGGTVCRICQLGKSVGELVSLGCACKGDLGLAHAQCAQAWFGAVKKSKKCELCDTEIDKEFLPTDGHKVVMQVDERGVVSTRIVVDDTPDPPPVREVPASRLRSTRSSLLPIAMFSLAAFIIVLFAVLPVVFVPLFPVVIFIAVIAGYAWRRWQLHASLQRGLRRGSHTAPSALAAATANLAATSRPEQRGEPPAASSQPLPPSSNPNALRTSDTLPV
eukprot:jgi/Chlat1/7950/Chrsp68S07372